MNSRGGEQAGCSSPSTANTRRRCTECLLLSTAGPDLPVFDLQRFLAAEDKAAPDLQRLCRSMAECLRATSALVVRSNHCAPPDGQLWGLRGRALPGGSSACQARHSLASTCSQPLPGAAACAGAGPTC